MDDSTIRGVLKAMLASDELRTLIRQEVDRSRSGDLRPTGYLPSSGGSDCVFKAPRDPYEAVGPEGLPMPPKHLWAGYGETVEQYLYLGRTNAESMERITTEAGVRWGTGIRVLDLGCASGTMLRWLVKHAAKDEIWGSDITADAIDWARRHLSPPMRFITNTTSPHLPFEDATFDLVYCGSVFTHIHETADSWMMEIARILRPNGLLYATIHDQHFIRVCREQAPDFWPMRQWLTRLTPEQQGAPFSTINFGYGAWAQTFYDTDYFTKQLCPRLEHVSTHPQAYGLQTAVLLRKR